MVTARGYTLVALVVLITVLQVLLAAALPVWSQVIQRDKEEELIFRGLQYAEAIRVFQTRFGRLPVRLEELLEVRPRSIRQLWKDPMTDDGEWALVLARVQGGPGEVGGVSAEGGTPGAGLAGDEERARSERRRRGRRGRAARPAAAPILGVHSRSEESAIRTFVGGATHRDWLFTADLIPALAAVTGENVPRLHTLWVGRGFPEGLEPQDGSGLEEIEAEEPERPRSRRGRRGRRGRGG